MLAALIGQLVTAGGRRAASMISLSENVADVGAELAKRLGAGGVRIGGELLV